MKYFLILILLKSLLFSYITSPKDADLLKINGSLADNKSVEVSFLLRNKKTDSSIILNDDIQTHYNCSLFKETSANTKGKLISKKQGTVFGEQSPYLDISKNDFKYTRWAILECTITIVGNKLSNSASVYINDNAVTTAKELLEKRQHSTKKEAIKKDKTTSNFKDTSLNLSEITASISVGINNLSDKFLDPKEYTKDSKPTKLDLEYADKPNIIINNRKIYNVRDIKLLNDSSIAIYGANGSFYFKKNNIKNIDLKNIDYILNAKLYNLVLSKTNFKIWKENNRHYDYDREIDKEIYKIYYNDELKGALYVAYKLDGTLVNKTNIKKRPKFYSEKNIPVKYRSKSKDYKHSGYDRGHLAPDASFDYDKKALRKVYSMANIIPQAPTVNRRTWIKTEKLERKIAYKLGSANVVIGVEYSKDPKRIGKNKIAVPSAFYKRITNKSKNYDKCFYYKNDLDATSKGDKLKDHLVDCNLLIW